MTVVAAPVQQTQAARLASLDALRGIAVVLVVWLHVTDHFSHWRITGPDASLVLNDLAHSVDFGRLGVVLFFAISGFIVPQSLHGECGAGLRRFMVRRFWRLFPLYWLSIPVGVVTTWWYYYKTIDLGDVLLNFTMVPQLLDYTMVQNLYWTLELELYFYLLLMLLFALRLHHRLGVMLAISAGLVACRAQISEPELSQWLGWAVNDAAQLLEYGQFLAIMFWGAGCRLLWNRWHHLDVNWQVIKAAPYTLANLKLIAGTLLFAGLTAYLLERPFKVLQIGLAQNNPELIRYAAPVLISVLFFLIWINWIKTAPRLLVWLGQISFSIYLLHPAVLYSVDVLLCRPGKGLTCQSGYDLSLASYFLASFIGVILLAALAHRWIEQPCIAAGRKYSR